MYTVIPLEVHNEIVLKNFLKRGYDQQEAEAYAKIGALASWHGIRTHNAIKAISLDDHFGSKVGGFVPKAKVEVLSSKFKAFEQWNSHKKSGPAVAFAAMDRAMELADEFGVGTVVVDNATHYLWGGGYVLYGADKGFISYTGCTSTLAEVVPFLGSSPTLGTNPHSWSFPTKSLIGYNITIDWATSTVAWGRVAQSIREGKELPPGAALDKDGNPTTDPHKAAAVTTFGGHKGFGLSLIDELWAAYIGGSLPSIRGRFSNGQPGEKHLSSFVFQCTHPDALNCHGFAFGRSQEENIKAILTDIRSHGNDAVKFPGQPEAENAKLSEKNGGLLFTDAEIKEFTSIAQEAEVAFDPKQYKRVNG